MVIDLRGLRGLLLYIRYPLCLSYCAVFEAPSPVSLQQQQETAAAAKEAEAAAVQVLPIEENLQRENLKEFPYVCLR